MMFMIVNDAEHLFKCLLAIWVSYLENVFAHFLIRLFIFMLLYEFFIHSESWTFVRYELQIFSPEKQLSWRVLIFFASQNIYILRLNKWHMLKVLFQKTSQKTKGIKK